MRRRKSCPDELAHASAILARLRWAVSRSIATYVNLERAAGLAAGTIGHMISGRRSGGRMGVWRAGRLATALNVRMAWLVLGEGPAWWRVRLDDWCGSCPICGWMTIGARCEAHGYLYRAEGDPRAVEIREEARRFTRLEDARRVAKEVAPARTVIAVRPQGKPLSVEDTRALRAQRGIRRESEDVEFF